jgi:hypothetical protein
MILRSLAPATYKAFNQAPVLVGPLPPGVRMVHDNTQARPLSRSGPFNHLKIAI